MTNLKEGKLTIGKIEVGRETELSELEEASKFNRDIHIRKRENDRASVRFTKAAQLGSKKFHVHLSFIKGYVWVIRLKAADPSINEWDYKSMLAQHGDWLVEQIGHPEGILDENVYEWGKITQWDDFRSRDAGISIIFFQNR